MRSCRSSGVLPVRAIGGSGKLTSPIYPADSLHERAICWFFGMAGFGDACGPSAALRCHLSCERGLLWVLWGGCFWEIFGRYPHGAVAICFTKGLPVISLGWLAFGTLHLHMLHVVTCLT
jgi:hypothetical protein